MRYCYICTDSSSENIIGVFTKLHAAEASFIGAFQTPSGAMRKSVSVRVSVDPLKSSRSNVWFRLNAGHMWRLCGYIDMVGLHSRALEFKYDRKIGRVVK